MEECAFNSPCALTISGTFASGERLCTTHRHSRLGVAQGRRRCPHPVRMQRPPSTQVDLQPDLPPDMAAPPGYKWDPDFPGTMKPGLCEDNYPLEEVLNSGVYERMKYIEKDIDACDPIVHDPDEDLLEWINKIGRLLPRDADVGDDSVAEALAVSDDDENDEDKAMLEYYSRQRSGAPPESDYGGMSESSFTEAGGL